jgi:hypothetical protein
MELQEAMQKLAMLKQLGAENLVIEQEKNIYHIQQEIMKMNEKCSIDAIDYLPKKCRYCTEFTEDQDLERLECSERKSKTCKNHEPANMSLLTSAFLKLLLAYGVFLLMLLTFSIITDIMFKFLDDKIVVFTISFVLLGAILILFRQPFKAIYKLLG